MAALTVLLCDPSEPDAAHAWAERRCPSYLGHDCVDVSDVSGQWDTICEYRFADPNDAVLFRLRWDG